MLIYCLVVALSFTLVASILGAYELLLFVSLLLEYDNQKCS